MGLNKRAVSPLIATVLLVMIVVSIGAAVMVVIQGLADENLKSIEDQQKLISCGNKVKAELLVANSNYRFCVSNNTLALFLDNSGQEDIKGFRVTVVGSTGYNATTYDTVEVLQGALTPVRFDYNNVGEVQSVMLNPRIAGTPSTEKVTCKIPSLEWDTDFISSMQSCDDTSWDDSITAATP